jgi:hypothetical protein
MDQNTKKEIDLQKPEDTIHNKPETGDNIKDIKENSNIENNNPNTINIDKKEKKEYNFCVPEKIGNKPDLMTKFTRSPAFKEIVTFLYDIQYKIKGMKKS